MDSVLLSVIVPIYNVREYVEKCIVSICNQTYRNLEIILVDDGSTDGCSEICDKYAKQDSRICVIHKKNGGLVSARKAGAEIATGQYIINVDGDDWIDNVRFQNLIKEIIKNQSDMIGMTGYVREYGKGYSLTAPEDKEMVYINKEAIKGCLSYIIDKQNFYTQRIPFSQWCWAVKREIYQKVQLDIDDRVCTFEDVLCMTACMLNSKKVSCINESSYHYVKRDSSIIRSATFNMDTFLIWRKQFKDYLQSYSLLESHGHLLRHITLFYLLGIYYLPFLKEIKGCLYPFSKVHRGSRIVLYGAGNFGRKIVNALREVPEGYKLILWADKNSGRIVDGWKISSIDQILQSKYDYVVVTILHADLAQQAKEELLGVGIPKEKIALIDTELINNGKLPAEFGLE